MTGRAIYNDLKCLKKSGNCLWPPKNENCAGTRPFRLKIMKRINPCCKTIPWISNRKGFNFVREGEKKNSIATGIRSILMEFGLQGYHVE